ncbi:MAG: hypothetical protein H0Z16_02055 [Thermodesulfobacterium sp.]|nr:hypothetical protein [Thermodesulfobacterium sp.]
MLRENLTTKERAELVNRNYEKLSVRKQCRLLLCSKVLDLLSQKGIKRGEFEDNDDYNEEV